MFTAFAAPRRYRHAYPSKNKSERRQYLCPRAFVYNLRKSYRFRSIREFSTLLTSVMPTTSRTAIQGDGFRVKRADSAGPDNPYLEQFHTFPPYFRAFIAAWINIAQRHGHFAEFRIATSLFHNIISKCRFEKAEMLQGRPVYGE